MAVSMKDRWMSGRVLMIQRHEGLSWKDAVIAAQQDWHEQECLESDFLAQRS